MLSEFCKFSIMSPLQAQVTALGTCSMCHTKTLVEKHRQAGTIWKQCSKCLRVFGQDDRAAQTVEVQS